MGRRLRAAREWVYRQVRPLPRSDDACSVSRGQFRRWQRRATIAFVLLAAISATSGWLGYDAAHDADQGFAREARQTALQSRAAVYNGCLGRFYSRAQIYNAMVAVIYASVEDPSSARARVFLGRVLPVVRRIVPLVAVSRGDRRELVPDLGGAQRQCRDFARRSIKLPNGPR